MAERKHPDPLVYTPAESARLFGCSQTWACRRLYAGRGQAITRFSRIMIPAYNGAIFPVQGGNVGNTTKCAATAQNFKNGGSKWRKALGAAQHRCRQQQTVPLPEGR